MKYFIYNEDGYGWFIFINENEEIPTNSIQVDSTCEFLKPKFNFKTKELEEGISKEELIQNNQLKIEELNKLQYEELLPTDWYFTRSIEGNIKVPEEIIEERRIIRLKFKQLKNDFT